LEVVTMRIRIEAETVDTALDILATVAITALVGGVAFIYAAFVLSGGM
jgi:hypothetical protein